MPRPRRGQDAASSLPGSRSLSPANQEPHISLLPVVMSGSGQGAEAIQAVQREVGLMEEIQDQMARMEERMMSRMEDFCRSQGDRLSRLEERLVNTGAPAPRVVDASDNGPDMAATNTVGPTPVPSNPTVRTSSDELPPSHSQPQSIDLLSQLQQKLLARDQELALLKQQLERLSSQGQTSEFPASGSARQLPLYPPDHQLPPCTPSRQRPLPEPVRQIPQQNLYEAPPQSTTIQRPAALQSHQEAGAPSLPSGDPVLQSHHGSWQSAVSYVLPREPVPHFKGETTANDPLKRNHEVESWIRSIENLVRPASDEAYIRAAKASCRGRADMIINSQQFDHIASWPLFKAELRRKFRGTYTAADFFKVLYSQAMSPNQAPMDYYLQIEASVYQGVRDHRDAIGDPLELVRRVFLSGLPGWLRDLLALKDDCGAPDLAEAAQRVWNSRNGIRHGADSSRHQSPNDITDHHPRRSPDHHPRYRDLHPVTAEPHPHTPPRTRQELPWCEFHKMNGHHTQDCRAAQRSPNSQPRYCCYRCGDPNHFSRNCPFLTGQGGHVPNFTGTHSPGDNRFRMQPAQTHWSHGSEYTISPRTTTRSTQC